MFNNKLHKKIKELQKELDATREELYTTAHEKGDLSVTNMVLRREIDEFKAKYEPCDHKTGEHCVLCEHGGSVNFDVSVIDSVSGIGSETTSYSEQKGICLLNVPCNQFERK